MANPYTVDVLGGLNIGNELRSSRMEGQQRDDQQRLLSEERDKKIAFKNALSGDPAAMEKLAELDPKMFMFQEKRQLDRQQREGAQRATAKDNAEKEWLIRYDQALKSGDQASKEALIKEAEQDDLNDFEHSQIGLDDETDKIAVGTNLYRLLGKDAYSQFYGSKDSKKDTRTAKDKDFEKYQKLLKENPKAAKVFGTGAGFLKDDKKRLFKIENGVKYFADGSEAPIGDNDKIKSEDMKNAMSKKQATMIVDKAKEGQLKNAGFALTLNDGLNNVSKMIDEGYDPMSAAWVNKYLAGTTLGNLIMSDEDQMFVGSVEQMINAIARRETGAAITEFEKKDFFNRYMPVAGDSKSRINQKKSALERQFRSIRGQSGSVYDAIRTTQNMGEDSPKLAAKPAKAAGNLSEGDIIFNKATGERMQVVNGQLQGIK